MTEGYSEKPLAKKLSLRDGQRVWFNAMPDSVQEEIGDYALDLTFVSDPADGVDSAHIFVTERALLAELLAMLRHAIAPDGQIWVSWPKRASGVATDITEDTIREVCLPLGLVDTKVCAVDAVWSGSQAGDPQGTAVSEPQHPFPALPAYSDAERVARARAAFERLRTRHSCRSFAETPVPREVIEYAIRAAGTAPSGANHQPWHFAVIGSAETKRAIRVAAEEEERAFYGADGGKPKASDEWLAALAPIGTDASKPFLESAPWLIVCFAQRSGGIDEDGKTQNYYVNESVGIACGMLIATLHEAGLATLTHTPVADGLPARDLRAAERTRNR